MTRDLYIRTKSEVRRYPLGKNTRPLTVVRRRLFRTDDSLMISDRERDHQFVMYDIESTQPCFGPLVSPDLTMAYTDIAKQAGKNQAVSKLGFLSTINPLWVLYGIIGAVIIYAVLTGGVISRRCSGASRKA